MNDDSQANIVNTPIQSNDNSDNVILHISDLHFIKNTNEIVIAKNDTIQRDLIRRLQELREQWKPNILCITGDISDKNKDGGYEQAQIFISRLADELGISPNNIVVCPGNHDFDRKKADRFFHNKTIQEVIDNFKVPISADYDEVFSNYIAFCEGLKIPKCTYGDYTSYLFGIRKVGDINFIICNSNWFYIEEPSSLSQSLGNGVQICLPLLEYLEINHNLLENKQEHQGFSIGLLHHPSDELDDKEKYRRSIYNDPPTADYLARRVNLVLTGHKHGLPLGIGSFLSAPSINCGSTLKETSIDKAFYIVKVTDNQIKYISFKIDPLSSENKWIRNGQEDSILNPIMQEKLNEYANTNTSPLIDIITNSANPEQPSSMECLGNEAKIFQTTNTSETISNLATLLEITMKLEKAELHIKKLEFTEAFNIIDQAEEALEPSGSTIQSDELSDIYTRIALIECTRANCIHLEQGVPEDYSVAKKYFERAKNAQRK